MNRIGLRLCGLLAGLLACLSSIQGQETVKPHVDIFSGVELNYRNIFYNNRLYDLLINLTPGIKWYMGNDWILAAQGIIPVYNDYGERYKKARLNMAVLSKEFSVGKQHLKVSGGLFGQERYGLDVKWMYPVNRWLAVDGQMGYTGYCSMAVDWECSRMDRVTGWLGARAYLEKYDTEFRLRGGRYIYEDYGVTGECMRHFRHCTVGVYAQYSNKGKENGGFKMIMMIPPYRRKTRKVNVRPASNFRLTYSIMSVPYAQRMYTTDPEENEREGYFNRSNVKWGSNLMEPDFKEKGERK